MGRRPPELHSSPTARAERPKLFGLEAMSAEKFFRLRLKLPSPRLRHTSNHDVRGIGQMREPDRRHRQPGHAPQMQPECSHLAEGGCLLGREMDNTGSFSRMPQRPARSVRNEDLIGGNRENIANITAVRSKSE